MPKRLELTTLLCVALALYVPHLAEEALTGMHDDALLARALAPFAALSPRHAAYVTFQAMLLVTLVTALAVARGGRARTAVFLLLGVSLLAEAHHVVRALATLRYNPGLATSIAMPIFGAYLLYVLVTKQASDVHGSAP